jgi:hypothetical protein
MRFTQNDLNFINSLCHGLTEFNNPCKNLDPNIKMAIFFIGPSQVLKAGDAAHVVASENPKI